MPPRSQVRGPTSALTEFLASQGIRASEINARKRQSEAPAPPPDHVTPSRARIPAGASMQFDEDDDLGDDLGSGDTATCVSCGTRFFITRYTYVCPTHTSPVTGAGRLCTACRDPAPRRAPKRVRRSAAIGSVVDVAADEVPTLQSLCINVRVRMLIRGLSRSGSIASRPSAC